MKFSEKGAGGGGQRPFENFPEIRPFSGRQASLRSPQPLQHAASRRTSECKRKQGRLGRGYTPTVLIETGVTNETTGITKR